MNRLITIAAVAAFAAAATIGHATASADDAPVYVTGAQYSATIDVDAGRWTLLPLDGGDLSIETAPCGAGTDVPDGVWLVERDAAGRPELRAPSTTALPAGHPGTIALRGCAEAVGDESPSLHAPQPLIDMLVASAGAVYVDG